MKEPLGGKGANLAEMTNIGLPVPGGFTVTTEACTEYYNQDKKLSDEIVGQINDYMSVLEKNVTKNLATPIIRCWFQLFRSQVFDARDDGHDPESWTHDETVAGIAKATNNERFAFDSYRRFIQMFGDVVQEIGKEKFDHVLEAAKEKNGYKDDTELTADDLKAIVVAYKKIVKDETGQDFPLDPKDQLLMAIEAVFRSWNNNRAISY